MDINDESVVVTLPQNGMINYDGMPCTPEPTVTMTIAAAGDSQTGNVQTLSKGTDYTVAWYDNEKIGKAYMVIKGTGAIIPEAGSSILKSSKHNDSFGNL